MKRCPLLFLALSAVLLSGCLPSAALQPVPTVTALPTSTPEPPPTATVIWFPPTPTPTPFPTREVSPTPEVDLNLGELILQDDFSTGSDWSLGETSVGTTALGKNELTIAIRQERAYLTAVRTQPYLDDFFLEIKAGPTLCAGDDEYGILFRYASADDYYRLSLSCAGQVRLERVTGGRAAVPQPWTLSGAFPPGAPSLSRIGIRADGSEIQVFINDIHQFTLNDPVLKGGSLGLFARSTGGHALTVGFSDLTVYAVSE